MFVNNKHKKNNIKKHEKQFYGDKKDRNDVD